MTTVDRAPLGGFEERLLTQLKVHVTTQPVPAAQAEARRDPGRRRVLLPRGNSILTAAPAGVAMLVAVLNILPGSQTALAQAFPILTQRSGQLPAALDRTLRSQHLPIGSQPTDRERAYAFQAPAGTGYVVVDQQDKWICLLVPGLTTGGGNIICETTFRLLSKDPRELQLSGERYGREQIVELLPRGSKAMVIDTEGAHPAALRHGILTLVSRRSVSVTTIVNGHRTTTTYKTDSNS